MPGITPIPDVPDAPTIGAVTDLGTGTSVSVAYTAAVTGGTVTTFTATSTPGSLTGTGSSPITVSGLTTGTAYTFKVKGTNATATGPESAASSSITPILPPSYESIATLTGDGSSSTITFNSIPSTYKHLQIRAVVNCGGAQKDTFMTFNGDSAANYSWHYLFGDGASVGAGATINSSNMFIGRSTANTTYVSPFVIDILDYTNTGKYKTSRALNGRDNNGDGSLWITSGAWRNTNAITSISFTPNGFAFNTSTKFALYGIKG